MKRKEAGFTLIELLIVLVISTLLTAAIYSTFIGQQRTYAIQTGVVDMQQNARAALTVMMRDLRMAGFCVGDSGFTVQDYQGNNITQAITVDESGTTDKITVVYAAEQVSYVTNVNGTLVTLDDASGFSAGQYIAFGTLRTIYTITSINGNILTLNSAPPAYLADMGVGANGADAFLVKAITYQVDTTKGTLERVESTDTTIPDSEDLWDDIGNYIEDLQVDYPYTGSNRLIRVTLTSSFQDHEGTARSRGYEAIIDVRNIGI